MSLLKTLNNRISAADSGSSLSAGEVCYLLFFGILLFAKGIGLYDGQRIFTVLLVIACLFWCGKILLTEHTVGELAVMAVLLVLGILSWRISGEKAALVNIMVVTGMKNIPVKRVFRLGAMVLTICFAVTTLLGTAGLISDTILVHEKLGLGHLIRYSLGYTHPNVLHVTYVVLLAFLFYALDLNRRQLLIATAAAFAGNLYIFLYSISYTGFVMCLLYLALNLYFQLRERLTSPERGMIRCVFPACALMSVAGPVLLNGSLFDLLNKVMNTRWTMSRYFLTEQKIGLFGTAFTQVPDSSYSIDCSYVYALMYYGVILFVLAFLACCHTVNCALRQDSRKELAILLALFVGGMIEPFLANFSFKNLTLIFIGACLYSGSVIRPGGAPGRVWNRAVRLTPWTEADEAVDASAGTGRIAGAAAKGARVQEKPGRRKHTCASYLRGRGMALLLVGILAGAAAGGICYTVNEPLDSVYVEAWLSDLYLTDGELVFAFPDAANMPEDWNGMIIGNADGETKAFEFTEGAILLLEQVRDAVSCGLYVGLLAAALTAAGLVLTGRRRERSRRPEEGG